MNKDNPAWFEPKEKHSLKCINYLIMQLLLLIFCQNHLEESLWFGD